MDNDNSKVKQTVTIFQVKLFGEPPTNKKLGFLSFFTGFYIDTVIHVYHLIRELLWKFAYQFDPKKSLFREFVFMKEDNRMA